MSVFNKDTIPQIQNSIQVLIHSIEREKINFRINQERFTKRLRDYHKLIGKPASLTKEQKLSIRKQKMDQIKNREIFSPNYGKRIIINSPEDEIHNLKKSASLNEIKLNSIKDGVNKQARANNRIKKEIDEIRKDKLNQIKKLQKITEENEEKEKEIIQFNKKNKRSMSRLNYEGLQKHRDENKYLEEKFKLDRETLEAKYHQVIEENIQRERLKINELGKQRMANAVFADNARKKGAKGLEPAVNYDKDEIQDRIPILNALLDKWNHNIKQKKLIINKYIANSSKIKETFDKLLLVLGLEKYEELPFVFEKEISQNAKIDEVLSNINNEVDSLKEQKILLLKKIAILQNNKKETSEKNELNIKEREINIDMLKKLNEDLESQINRKKMLFTEMEESTLNFLQKMEDTYLSDFVVKKMNIEENSKLNEKNVLDYLGSVYCYVQLINDFNENVQMKKDIKSNLNKSNLANKSIENLDKEIKFKLSKFNYNNCLKKVKHDTKQKNVFDDVIKRLANEIVKDVNNNYDSMNEDTKIGTNVSNSVKNKNKENVRYQK